MPIEILPYDKTSLESIINYAQQLLGKSLRALHPNVPKLRTSGKGKLGQAVEKYHFCYEPNSVSDADFPEAGLELKCTPLQQLKNGDYSPKERLVLNIINFMEEADKSFYTSSFWHKCSLILLMFYLNDDCIDDKGDMLFKIIRLWKIPKEDVWMFLNDWKKIHKMILDGKAHELSEGMTYYLGACTKGSRGGANKRQQPYSKILADQRAYSIKPGYINYIILDSIGNKSICTPDVFISEKKRETLLNKKSEIENIVKNKELYENGQDLDEIVEHFFTPFYGKSVNQIETKLNVKVSDTSKAMSFSLCRAILHIQSPKIGEFEKADIVMKTIRLEENGSLKESMSFPNIKFKEVYEENEWEDSAWYNILNHRFFFVVFRKKDGGTSKDAVLEKAFFWGMPYTQLQEAESFWKDTRDKIRNNDYNHFLKQSEHPICHVRPKGRDSLDLMETPQGNKEKKKCYWLNREYILKILKENGIEVTSKN